MLPYLAQGANSSLEDGAVLGSLLGYMKQKSDLPDILRLYEKLRKSRGEAIVRETFKQVRLSRFPQESPTTVKADSYLPSLKQRNDFHMPNGPEQQKRDQIFLSQLGKELKGAFPSRWYVLSIYVSIHGLDVVDGKLGYLTRDTGHVPKFNRGCMDMMQSRR